MVITAPQVDSYVPPVDTDEYEIRIVGHLDPRWVAWFDGMELTAQSDGTTVIRGSVVDQAALHGLLQKLSGIGLPLISLVQLPRTSDQHTPGATT